MLRHLHRWVILHWLSKVTLWYYITPSAVIAEDANKIKWQQISKLVLISSSKFSPWTTADAQIIWQRQLKREKTQLVAHITDSLLSLPLKMQLHTAHWANCSSQGKQTDAVRAWQDWRTWRRRRDRWSFGRCSSASSRQKCSCFYLQRRHDIPCPLKPATERCSPCSCCRCPSLAITSTAKKGAARNPIGLTGTVPNSNEWRHWARRVRGRESQRKEHREECRTETMSRGVANDTLSWRQRQQVQG